MNRTERERFYFLPSEWQTDPLESAVVGAPDDEILNMGVPVRKFIKGGVAAVLAALFVIVIGVQPAQAGWYNYLVGHPLYKMGLPQCTGGYVINGASGTFILTAGHCYEPGQRVEGTTSGFGTMAYRYCCTHQGDSGIVRVDAGVDMYQTIIDPLSGDSPGPNQSGQVTGKMPNSEQLFGTAVGKMGKTTGWTEGTIVLRYANWKGVYAHCANYHRDDGDSGGPVWRHDSQGLRAVGMHVGALPWNGQNLGCYQTMDDLLSQWGASMNFWPRYAGRGDISEEGIMPSNEGAELAPIVTEADGAILQFD